MDLNIHVNDIERRLAKTEQLLDKAIMRIAKLEQQINVTKQNNNILAAGVSL